MDLCVYNGIKTLYIHNKLMHIKFYQTLKLIFSTYIIGFLMSLSLFLTVITVIRIIKGKIFAFFCIIQKIVLILQHQTDLHFPSLVNIKNLNYSKRYLIFVLVFSQANYY